MVKGGISESKPFLILAAEPAPSLITETQQVAKRTR